MAAPEGRFLKEKFVWIFCGRCYDRQGYRCLKALVDTILNLRSIHGGT
jgi:hypothetical protein